MFLLVPAYPGSPGQKAVKWLCVCVCVHACVRVCVRVCLCLCDTDNEWPRSRQSTDEAEEVQNEINACGNDGKCRLEPCPSSSLPCVNAAADECQ